MDIWGRSLWDYHIGKRNHPLYLDTSFGPREIVPLEEFYRADLAFDALDNTALSLCRGAVLDIGAGAGAHTLALQNRGMQVTALEASPLACQVMQNRGVQTIINLDFYQFTGGPFHTLLLLMNGAGLAGDLSNLNLFLSRLRQLTARGGRIIMDSCDVRYLFSPETLSKDGYYGEMTYRYYYKGRPGDAFSWLFVDATRLMEHARAQGLGTQIVYQEDSQYLAMLTPI